MDKFIRVMGTTPMWDSRSWLRESYEIITDKKFRGTLGVTRS